MITRIGTSTTAGKAQQGKVSLTAFQRGLRLFLAFSPLLLVARIMLWRVFFLFRKSFFLSSIGFFCLMGPFFGYQTPAVWVWVWVRFGLVGMGWEWKLSNDGPEGGHKLERSPAHTQRAIGRHDTMT
jgi:hypothetical protein